MEAGLIAVAIPEQFGGLGVTSTYDLGVGMAILARGCASTALGLNMHVAVCHNLTRRWTELEQAGDTAGAGRLRAQLTPLGTGQMITCGPASEPGTNVVHPELRATPVTDGWRLDGMKVFATFSPAANWLAVTARVDSDEGPRLAFAMVPAETPGVLPCDDWDALGVRASGSQSIRFDGAVIAEPLVRVQGRWGAWDEGWLEAFITGTYGIVTPFCGVAEQAHHLTVAALSGRTKGPSHVPLVTKTEVQSLVGANAADLVVCHGAIERVGRRIDEIHDTYPGRIPTEVQHRVFAELQAAKQYVTRTAITIVDRCLTLSGGAGYQASNPLGRLWRDARAGPFMQPMSELDGPSHIGRVVLGVDLTWR
jgi:alkylation response protein AidB-like acyl-CoA dehydrogenase